METSNSIVCLAVWALETHPSQARLERELQSLFTQGLSNDDIDDALRIAHSDTCPSLLTSQIARLCDGIVTEDAGIDIHLSTEAFLRERSDVESLSLSVGHYETVSERLDPGSRVYGLVLQNEAFALSTQAGLSQDPEANLWRAITLYKQARQCFTVGSEDYGVVLLNEGCAREDLIQSNRELEALVELNQAKDCLTASLACFKSSSLLRANAQAALASVLRHMGHISEAYEHLQQALDIFEAMRAQFRQESERISYLETVAVLFAEIVALCLTLADAATTPAQAEQWQWKAWHWVHRGKSRSLLDRLAEAGLPGAVADAAHAWAELDELGQTLDTCERELWVKLHQLEATGMPRATVAATPALQPVLEAMHTRRGRHS